MQETFWEIAFKGISIITLEHEQKGRNINILPPLIFWGGGLIVWYQSNGWGLSFLQHTFEYLKTLNIIQVGVFLFFLVSLMIVSCKFAEWLQFPLIRFMEGYWPFPLSTLSNYLVDRLDFKLKPMEDEWNTLAKEYEDSAKKFKQLNNDTMKKYNKLEEKLRQYPVSLPRLPTKFGNIMRAAEEYPNVRYGLDTITVWPNLWLIMPDRTREELSVAKTVLYDRVILFFWCSIFWIWMLVAWKVWNSLILWPLITSILGIIFVYYITLIPAASNFGDILRASFDLHRFILYESLHLPLPSNPNNEEKDGENLSQYLKRGYPYSNSNFTHVEIKTEVKK